MEAHLKQGTQEWLEFRKGKITASEIPIILGVSKWATPLQLWKRKLGFAPEQADNPAMKRGRWLEDSVTEAVNKQYGTEFAPKVFIHPEIKWAMASLDGFDETTKLALEVKCPGAIDHQCALDGEVPEKYKGQVQWQLFCGELEENWYVSHYNNREARVIVKRDDEYLAKVLPLAAEFYRCVVEMEEPPYTEKDSVQIDDDLFNEYSSQWKEIARLKKDYTEKEKFYKEKLASFSDDGNIHGNGVRLTRVNREGNIEWHKLYDRIIEKYPQVKESFNSEDYRKEQMGYWKISEYKD